MPFKISRSTPPIPRPIRMPRIPQTANQVVGAVSGKYGPLGGEQLYTVPNPGDPNNTTAGSRVKFINVPSGSGLKYGGVLFFNTDGSPIRNPSDGSYLWKNYFPPVNEYSLLNKRIYDKVLGSMVFTGGGDPKSPVLPDGIKQERGPITGNTLQGTSLGDAVESLAIGGGLQPDQLRQIAPLVASTADDRRYLEDLATYHGRIPVRVREEEQGLPTGIVNPLAWPTLEQQHFSFAPMVSTTPIPSSAGRFDAIVPTTPIPLPVVPFNPNRSSSPVTGGIGLNPANDWLTYNTNVVSYHGSNPYDWRGTNPVTASNPLAWGPFGNG